jgi:hypothetical protein
VGTAIAVCRPSHTIRAVGERRAEAGFVGWGEARSKTSWHREGTNAMRLTVDPLTLDLDEWDVELHPYPDWLGPLWGIEAGVSSPVSSRRTVHPSCQASAGWLHALWGYPI